MLQPLLVRTMEATGAFRAVLSGPYSGAYGVGLRAEIVELVQDFAQDPPQLRLTLRARLSEGSSNRLLATRLNELEHRMDAHFGRAHGDAPVLRERVGIHDPLRRERI